MTPITGFIFDLDGVLTDTAELHYRSWKRLADEEGLTFTREDNDQLRSVPREESLKRLLKGRVLSPELAANWMARKNAYYLADLEHFTPEHLLPGVAVFLADAQAQGIGLAVASASRNARIVLQRLGIIDMLVAIGDGGTVSRSKPAPDLILWAAGQLGLPPEQCVVFEDAQAGIDAALAAGAFAVGIGPAARVKGAHLHLPDGLYGITVADLIARLGG